MLSSDIPPISGPAGDPETIKKCFDAVSAYWGQVDDSLVVGIILLAAVVGLTAPAKDHAMHRAALYGLDVARSRYPDANVIAIFEYLLEHFSKAAQDDGEGSGGIPTIRKALSMFKPPAPN